MSIRQNSPVRSTDLSIKILLLKKWIINYVTWSAPVWAGGCMVAPKVKLRLGDYAQFWALSLSRRTEAKGRRRKMCEDKEGNGEAFIGSPRTRTHFHCWANISGPVVGSLSLADLLQPSIQHGPRNISRWRKWVAWPYLPDRAGFYRVIHSKCNFWHPLIFG